jgi:hypothetical protein
MFWSCLIDMLLQRTSRSRGHLRRLSAAATTEFLMTVQIEQLLTLSPEDRQRYIDNPAIRTPHINSTKSPMS